MLMSCKFNTSDILGSPEEDRAPHTVQNEARSSDLALQRKVRNFRGKC